MSKLRSEILFNRALLWLVLSCIVGLQGDKTLALINLVPCVYDVYKSLGSWGDDE